MSTTRAKIALPQGAIFWLFIFAYLYFFGMMLSGFFETGQSKLALIRETAALIFVVGIVVALVAQDFAKFKRLLRDSHLMIAYGALVFVSCLWSDGPGWTVLEAFRLIIAGAFGIAAAAQLDTERHMRVLCSALLIIGIASAVVALGMPGKGLMSAADGYEGAWRGVFLHKSYLGRAMALGFLCGLYLMIQGKMLFVSFPMVLISVPIIILARSMTALVLVAGFCAVAPALRLMQKRPSLFRSVCAWAILAAGIGILWELHQGEISPLIHDAAKEAAALIGKNLSVTGRDVIWRAALAVAMEKPVLGHGYTGRWIHLGPGAWIQEAVGWRVDWVENSYLELWMQIGLAGLLLVVLMLGRFLLRAFNSAMKSPGWSALWPLNCCAMILVLGVDESLLARPVEPAWIILVFWGCHFKTHR